MTGEGVGNEFQILLDMITGGSEKGQKNDNVICERSLSAVDLHEQVVKVCPEGTPIPSIQWLRFQFWPRRPCSKAAEMYSGKLKVKFMVQARQLRSNHPDAHYASALYRYEKEFAIKFKDQATFVSLDDKHTVKVGEPGHPVAAVERGKQVLVAIGKTFAVSDHDFTKFSLTPSVTLAIQIPDTIEGSFYTGNVYVNLKENAFQPSSGARHMAELNNLLATYIDPSGEKPVLLLYTDGGPDHRLTYLSVQLTLIALFIQLDLDILVAVRTPPGHSWKNPVERIMSILNMGFQGIGVVREETRFEDELKGCSSLKDIRALADKVPELKDAVLESVTPTRDLIKTVIQRLKLKGTSFTPFESCSEEEVMQLWNNILKVDDTLTTADRTQQQAKSKEQLQAFMKTHCQARHYSFSIKKCGLVSCRVCKPPRLHNFEDLHHLPDPVPDGSSLSYKSFEDVYGSNTTEEHRPSLLKTKEDSGMPFNATAQTAKNVGLVIQCQECDTFRTLHAAKKLKKQDVENLQAAIETLLYTCGSSLQAQTDEQAGADCADAGSLVANVYVRGNLSCGTPTELCYYSAGFEPICYHCGSEEVIPNDEDHYPFCIACKNKPHKARRGRKQNKP